MIWICIPVTVGILAVLWILSVAGRRNAPGLDAMRGRGYAHRGLFVSGEIPENSMAAFRRAAAHGFGSELDVHLTADGDLAVIHDASLLRTAGADVFVEDLTVEELDSYRLEGTQEKIPTLRQVLEMYDGSAPLIIELKPARGNHTALAREVVRQLEGYPGPYACESFDPRCLMALKKIRPEILRGQLAQNFFRERVTGMPRIVDFVLTHLMTGFLTRPDFIAYRYSDRKGTGNRMACGLLGLASAVYTITDPADYRTAMAEGSMPIFEQFIP